MEVCDLAGYAQLSLVVVLLTDVMARGGSPSRLGVRRRIVMFPGGSKNSWGNLRHLAFSSRVLTLLRCKYLAFSKPILEEKRTSIEVK